MRTTKMYKAILNSVRLALVTLLATTAYAATPGISGPTFNLTAQPAFLNQPDGNAVYSWGYGCTDGGAGETYVPLAAFANKPNCPTMQVPGPTLVVTEGQTVTVTLTNNLPTPAGNTSILFPGFTVTSTTGVPGLLTQEAAPGSSVTYTFVASSPGTRAYYSGTQGDLQIEMGLYGALVVLPSSAPAGCSNTVTNLYGKSDWATVNGVPGAPEQDFRLAHAAYDHPKTCYDREYLFQWAEMDPNIHNTALAQVTACTLPSAPSPCTLQVPTEPYHPAYFLINGRSMPDVMDANYAAEYPHQPYNGNPHMHPGEQVLIRTIGQGRWEHPFHEHANHVRILARDGNLVLSQTSPAANLAGLLMFNTDTFPGQAFDGIFYFSGRGLNWDMFGHTAKSFSGDPLAELPCTPDANGYNTLNGTAVLNYYEWCQDHNKPVEANPFGDVTGGGPATFPDPNIFTNGAWYGGTPYFGPDASLRASTTLKPVGDPTYTSSAPGCTVNSGATPGTTAPVPPGSSACTNLQPSNVQANPANERGWAFMWHSHNEREITTNNVFPGGMLMMMLVDSREFVIDESL